MQGENVVKKSVIWDLDGTLFDSYDVIVESIHLALQEHSIRMDLDQIRQYAISFSIKALFASLSEEYGVSAQLLHEAYSRISVSKYLQIKRMPHVFEILDKLVAASYSLLGLISYLTAGEDECRAWTITKGTKAPQAAGKIHTDFERGFIRAEVIAYDDLMANKTMQAAKEKGLVRSEGKEYVVKDGDIILFRFNV